MEKKQPWLLDQTWDRIIELNRSLCQTQKVDCKLTPQGGKAQALWDESHGRTMKLVDALELCRACNDLRPFLFNCSNTFTTLGTNLVEPWASQLSSLEAHMLRQTTAHFVDGRVDRSEVMQILRFVKGQPPKPAPKKATPTASQPSSSTPVGEHQLA